MREKKEKYTIRKTDGKWRLWIAGSCYSRPYKTWAGAVRELDRDLKCFALGISPFNPVYVVDQGRVIDTTCAIHDCKWEHRRQPDQEEQQCTN